MPDPDETDDAMDSLSWPDTSRPIISNNYPAAPPKVRSPAPRPSLRAPRSRRWPIVLAGVALLVVLVAIVLIWLL